MTDALRGDAVKRVLLVEDEPEVCAFLTEELEPSGYELVCVTNDQAAYDLLDREWRTFSAVILDVNLGPGTTGFDVARYARRLNASIAVIFTTGFDAENSVVRYGVNESVFVPKPFTGKDMLIAIEEVSNGPGAVR
ncbi:MAG: response regulator [Proteobacteria bacterium]|nr:response regulator [Pseudomonadota bacterium]